MKVGGTPAHNHPGRLEGICSANQNCPDMETDMSIRKNCPEKGPSKNVAQVKNTGPSETLGGYLTCARFWH